MWRGTRNFCMICSGVWSNVLRLVAFGVLGMGMFVNCTWKRHTAKKLKKRGSSGSTETTFFPTIRDPMTSLYFPARSGWTKPRTGPSGTTACLRQG